MLFSIGRPFFNWNCQNASNQITPQIADRAAALAEAREAGCKLAKCGDRASCLRGKGFLLHGASNRTIAKAARDVPRAPEALIAKRNASDWTQGRRAVARTIVAKHFPPVVALMN